MNKTQNPLEILIQRFARLPGLGPKSAQRIVLSLVRKQETTLKPLIHAMEEVKNNIHTCSICGNIDLQTPCSICTNPSRNQDIICVIEDIGSLWALEKTAYFKGVYHTLGGTLSAIDGNGPEQLKIPQLLERIQKQPIAEIILATSATVEGQTTAHYIASQIESLKIPVSILAKGVPMGGELDYLDEGTLTTAFQTRRPYF